MDLEAITNIEADPSKELMERLGEADITVYEVLNPSNIAEARQEFLANDDMVSPNFEYDNINPEQISANLASIAEIREQLPTTNLEKIPRLTAEISLNDIYWKNEFVAACDRYNRAETPEEKTQAETEQREANHRLYGEPKKETFLVLVNEELSKINPENLDNFDHKVYETLLGELGDIDTSNSRRFRPKDETVKEFSEMINFLFKNFLDHIPENQDIFTTAEACAITNEIIFEEIGATATDYRAIMDEKASNVSVDHQARVIKFPVNRASGNFTREGLKAILVHELGTHAYRAMVYEESDIPALSHGLPGNEEIDEGIAKCCEQAIKGSYQDSGIFHYVNIGLANFKNKNFREVFEIQRMLNYLQHAKPGVSMEEKQALYHQKDALFFNRTMRCFRGTGTLPNNKDLVYYNGANRIWQYIEEHINDPMLLDNLFLSGKSNILDQERLVYETKV